MMTNRMISPLAETEERIGQMRDQIPDYGSTFERKSPAQVQALLDEFLILAAAAFHGTGTGGFGKLLVNLHLVAWLALLGDEINDLLNLVILHQRALRADGLGRAGWLIKHVALAQKFLRAHFVKDDATVNF